MLAFFGDGTCNNGQFYECLNMAALWKLAIVFVVEKNLRVIGMSHFRATSDPQIWKKGPAFRMPGFHVDGMDVLKVREVAKEAITRAIRGEGPTLVECETYRFRGHSLADPDELRDPAEKAHYATQDPITALKKYLLENSLATRGQLLENVFADPRGFGIGPDGKYRCRKIARNVMAMATREAPAEVVATTELPEIVGTIQESWDKVEDKYAVTSLAVAGGVAVLASSGMISAIDRLPPVPGVLELVGIGYTAWFAYKNLVFKPDR
ncbi:Pyruvate dehydrogenase E1 component subunit alpha-3, chloroplastic [Olea europaea subsp. europaea]|uniref:Pyruvate dehydrogenase E1 component subunit alpha-3, chloroplastic n=1 Tax=Olea europaea subsp. europaea TaxID=158383 RepID=A0A8S0QM03_OLEEU|nr:Pyruvate dehydrogenase E1 component subunit alpha-3, chloroplastic [Olea europaea subsp. europaea]